MFSRSLNSFCSGLCPKQPLRLNFQVVLHDCWLLCDLDLLPLLIQNEHIPMWKFVLLEISCTAMSVNVPSSAWHCFKRQFVFLCLTVALNLMNTIFNLDIIWWEGFRLIDKRTRSAREGLEGERRVSTVKEAPSSTWLLRFVSPWVEWCQSADGNQLMRSQNSR